MCIFPTDFLRTLSQPSSKSPQKFAVRPYLSENQCTILNYIAYRKCRFCRFETDKTDISDTCRFHLFSLVVFFRKKFLRAESNA